MLAQPLPRRAQLFGLLLRWCCRSRRYLSQPRAVTVPGAQRIAPVCAFPSSLLNPPSPFSVVCPSALLRSRLLAVRISHHAAPRPHPGPRSPFCSSAPFQPCTMPAIALPPPGLHYYLLSLSSNGKEVPEEDGTLLSADLLSRVRRRTRPVTDVFLVSHGWNTTAEAAADAYSEWMGAMAADRGGLAAAASARGGAFNPLLVGLRWPSKFGDGGADRPPVSEATAAAAAATADADAQDRGGDSLGGEGTAARDAAAVDAAVAALWEAFDPEDAERVAADPTAAAALTTLAAAMVTAEGAAPVLAAASGVASEEGAGVEGEAEGGGEGDGPSLPTPVLEALATLQVALSPADDDDDAEGNTGEEYASYDGGDDGGDDGGSNVARSRRSWRPTDAAAATAAFRNAVAAEAAQVAARSSRGNDVDPDAETDADADADADSTTGSRGSPLSVAALLTRPLAEVVFAAYARRASSLGRGLVARLLTDLQQAAAARGGGPVHFHGIGHSLGAHLLLSAVASAAATAGSAGDTGGATLALQSLSLVQGAVPATDLHPGGAYAGVHAAVDGPIVVTRSSHDGALEMYRVWYGPPLGLVGAVPPPHLPPLAEPVPYERVMRGGDEADGASDKGGGRQSYGLPGGGAVVNVDASAVINEDGGRWDVVGATAHNDVSEDPVVALVWEAVLTTLWRGKAADSTLEDGEAVPTAEVMPADSEQVPERWGENAEGEEGPTESTGEDSKAFLEGLSDSVREGLSGIFRRD